jgi:hypothetical protein
MKARKLARKAVIARQMAQIAMIDKLLFLANRGSDVAMPWSMDEPASAVRRTGVGSSVRFVSREDKFQTRERGDLPTRFIPSHFFVPDRGS